MYWIKSEPLSVEKLQVAITDLPKSLQGTKIVQLSDFHYDGPQLAESLLSQVIQVSNREEPDLIVLTGDYVTHDPSPINRLVLRLKNLRSRFGIYAILGNHDLYYFHSQAVITEAFTRIGISVLWNEIAYPWGEQFPLIGLADFWSGDFRPAPIMEQLDPKIPRLVLSHNPDSATVLRKWRIDLQLSGHTHGGQVIIPGLGPLPKQLRRIRKYVPKNLRPYLPYMQDCPKVVKNWKWSQGFHHIGTNQLYVNRGLGSYFPGRLFCPPEVTVITLVSQGN